MFPERRKNTGVYPLLFKTKVGSFTDALKIINTYCYRWSVEDFFRSMKQELGIEKVMVRTLRRINKLIEIAMLDYLIAFRILIIGGGKFVDSILLAGGKLGLKKKDEDTIGRILKVLANIFNENDFVRNKSNRVGHKFLHI